MMLLPLLAAAAIDWGAVAAVRIGTNEVSAIDLPGVGRVWQRPSPIPYDVVAWIESTGTQYIDTGISLASGSFEMGVDFDESSTVNNCAIAVQGDASSGTTQQKRLAFYHNGANSNYIIDRGTAGSRINKAGYSVDTGKLAFAIVLNTSKRLYICRANGINIENLRGRVRYLKLWDADGILVRDLVPVRVGTAGALYDRVSGQLFLSATSTPLVAGPDKPD